MKHNRRLIPAVEKQLIDDIQNNRDQNQSDAIARDSQDLANDQLRQ
jgi:hypothetical protein